MLWLLIAFVVVPILEIMVLAEVAGLLGWGWALFWIVAVSVIGATLVKREGLSTLRRADERVRRGELPTDELVGGIVLLAAGALMLTPGFLTDAVGLVLLLPPTRALTSRAVHRRFRTGPLLGGRTTSGGFSAGWSTFGGRQATGSPGSGEVWDAASREVGAREVEQRDARGEDRER